jgi:hypothetical protein
MNKFKPYIISQKLDLINKKQQTIQFNSRLANACRGKSYQNGGLNVNQMKDELIKYFPEDAQLILTAMRYQLNNVYCKYISSISSGTNNVLMKKNLQMGGVIKSNIDIDHIFKNTFKDLHVNDNDIMNVKHKAIQDINYLKQPPYQIDKYSKNVQQAKCNIDNNKQGTIFWKNTYASKNFLDEEGNVYENPDLSQLPFTNSIGDTKWNSFNWVIYKNIYDDKIYLGIIQLDDSNVAEIGSKHIFIAWPHDIYVGGEMRTIKNQHNQKIIQFNLNSSINLSKNQEGNFVAWMYGGASIITSFWEHFIPLFITNILKETESDIIVQMWKRSYGEYIDQGLLEKINPIFYMNGLVKDPGKGWGGVLYYYKDNVCPTKDYINKALAYSKSKLTNTNRYWLTFPNETEYDAGTYIPSKEEFIWKD